ncbi:hypothetical protein FA13DRAFT_800772 [Coprinellus micaceus]|uniref:Uncharacterized protein n=1 Tax=Coprinellus micaceus TaxID=71717 RepID=A0A4Y7S5V5_COPMI|nr:hypothetical protein FA13DRAFT_800772 [Coprinellus micaceus]
MYFSGMGGRHPVLFLGVCVSCLGLCEVGIALQTWFLGCWASKYADHAPDEVPVVHYVGQYILCCTISLSIYILAYIIYIRGAIRASRTVHNDFIRSILGTTMRRRSDFGWAILFWRVHVHHARKVFLCDDVHTNLHDPWRLRRCLRYHLFAPLYQSTAICEEGDVYRQSPGSRPPRSRRIRLGVPTGVWSARSVHQGVHEAHRSIHPGC